MAAKKDPYKRIQKRFVQARAGEVAYEDLSPEQRERFQNRFNMLAQTVEGRGKIAQRILGPDAPQERVRALRQRIRQNLPSSGGGTTTSTEPETPPAGPTVNNARLAPTSADIMNMRAGFRAQGSVVDANRRAAAAASNKVTTTTTTKKKGSDRIGSGFWSIPKNPIEAIKEVGRGAMDIVDYTNRAYINPVINVAGAAADVVGGRKGSQKFRPLPTLSKQEIAIESALTVGTAGAGLLLKPLVQPTGKLLGQVGSALVRRGAVGTGTVVSNISTRQANLAAVRAASAAQTATTQMVRQALAEQGDSFLRTTRPSPSGVVRSTPKSSGLVKSPTAATTVTKAATKTSARTGAKGATKAAAKRAATKAATQPTAVVAPKITTKQIETSAEAYAGRGASRKSLEFPGQGPVKSKGRSFAEEFGEIEMTSTSYEPTPVVQRKTTTSRSRKSTKPAAQQTAKPVAEVKDVEAVFGPVKWAEPETVGPAAAAKKSNRKAKPISVTPISTKGVTREQIETATEKYAPGFNKEIGEIEMRSTQYEAIELARPSSPVAEVQGPTFGPSQEQREKALNFAKETIEWVEKEKQKLWTQPPGRTRQLSKYVQEPVSKTVGPMETTGIPASPVAEVAAPTQPKRATRKAAQKKSQVAAPKTVEQAPVAPTQRKVTVAKSRADVLYESMQKASEAERAAKKAAFPGFTPKKVTKLPKRDPALDRLEARGSMLFRMYDEGAGSRARPSGATESGVQRGIPMQNQLDDVVDMMQGGGSGQFRAGEIPVGSKEVQKEIERTMVQPNVVIKRGEAINPRYTRRTQPTKKGEMPMPTSMSKGVEEFKPTRMPLSTETGLSSEQRRSKFYREMFPEARSAREARKLYYQSIGQEAPLTSTGEFGPIGNPLGAAAKKSPVTTAEIQVPTKYEKVINAKGEVVNKPVAFRTETVPAIWTLESGKQPTPIEELPERWLRGGPQAVEAGRKARKAETLKSQATQAARLRNRGIQGEARGATLQETLDDIKKGKAFQRRFDDISQRNKK